MRSVCVYLVVRRTLKGTGTAALSALDACYHCLSQVPIVPLSIINPCQTELFENSLLKTVEIMANAGVVLVRYTILTKIEKIFVQS